jgi:anthranilate synthase component 1
MDTCIAIRLAFKKNGKVFVRSGAGIVADSVPETEYRECENKMRGVLNALEEAQTIAADTGAAAHGARGHKE